MKKGSLSPTKDLGMSHCVRQWKRNVLEYISIPGLILRKSGTKLIYILFSRAKKEIYVMNIFNEKKQFLVLNVI